MRWNRVAAALSALLLISIGACGNNQPKAGNGLEKKSITVAALPLLDVAALHIAQERDLFAAEGLQVRIEPVAQSLAALPALKNGQVDVIAGGNYVTFLQANQQGAMTLRVLAPASAVAPGFMQLVVLPESPIRQLSDLTGKTVAVNILNNIQSLTFNELLTAAKVDPAGVKYRAVQFPLMDKALANSDVDAILTAEPFGTVITTKLPARTVLDAGTGPAAGLPISGYVSTAQWTSKYPKTAAAFQRAILKGQALAAGDRALVERVLPGYAKVDATTARNARLPAYPTANDRAGLQKLADLMAGQRLLPARADVTPVIFTPPAA
ncbi:ABC transporter substrate-binding protein [Actinoplanes sp. NPDC049265]|uniref:ABC transporter substrate-binding protein n=1 Tax=Actinoplanes sp. NPDC049265 TaxID=3363902 RepID=UPI003723E12E